MRAGAKALGEEKENINKTFEAEKNYVGFNNKVYYRLSHDVVTGDVDRDISTAHC